LEAHHQSTGYYYNCNTKDNKEKFDKNGLLGVGMIHRDQPIQVTNAIRAAMYLVNPEKEDQRLRAKTSPQMRTFGTGQFEVKWRRDIEKMSHYDIKNREHDYQMYSLSCTV
jgi:hypothetical protein